MIAQSELKELLHYSVITGQFYWLKSNSSRAKVGSIAGSLMQSGYRRTCVNGNEYYIHRLAWFYVTGEWPANMVDHINGIKDANQWLNLREATCLQNAHNSGVRPSNKSGYKGVSWSVSHDRWLAQIRINGKKKNLGLYETPQLAYAEYCKVAKNLHGAFALL